MAMDYLKYKGYTGSVEFNATDDCLHGKVLGMTKDSITYEGETVSELKTDFQNAIDSYIEGCQELNCPAQTVQRCFKYTDSVGNSRKSGVTCYAAGNDC